MCVCGGGGGCVRACVRVCVCERGGWVNEFEVTEGRAEGKEMAD